MRFFPATARRRLVAACVATGVGLGALSVPLAHADTQRHLRHQQSQAQHAIKRAQVDLDETSKQTRQAYAALTSSRAALHRARHDLQVARKRVEAARQRYRQMERALERAKARLVTAQSDLADGKQAVIDQHAHLVDTVTSLYEQGDPQLVGFLSLMNAQTPADLTRRNEANNVVLDSQNNALDDLQAAQVMLTVREKATAKAEADVTRRQQQAHANLVLKKQYKQDAVTAKAAVRREVRHRKHAWAMARRARAHDRAKKAAAQRQAARYHRMLLAEIAREKRAAARRAAQRARNHTTGHISTSGVLGLPVSGPVTSPYGYRENPIGHYWGLHDGEDFGAPCGAPLWAAGNGRVLAEYYSSIWGNRLYLNLGLINGQNVTVIYNHMSAYRVHTGQSVSRGEVVGRVGTTGWSTGCHLHFTVMVNGVATNPAPWLA